MCRHRACALGRQPTLRAGRGGCNLGPSLGDLLSFAVALPSEKDRLVNFIADVGLIGLPNAGKSTLISRISAAKPRIADYPFTTLEPHLGVVDVEPHGGFVVADIPGLIEGAAHGAGLGIRFLRHIERTRLLVHVVDVADGAQDPAAAVETVEGELRAYNPSLLSLPRIVAANKIDLPHGEGLARLTARCRGAGISLLAVSALTGDGIPGLLEALATRLRASQGQPYGLPQSPLLR